jgi:hypothetical protein
MIWSQCSQPSMLYHFHFSITTIGQHGHFRLKYQLAIENVSFTYISVCMIASHLLN